MKAVILALLVLVVVGQGEALQCNCGGTSKPCSGAVETCYGSNQVCGSITFQASGHVSYLKGCMKKDDCNMMSNSEVSYGYCCNWDRCNR